jgi:heme exporter protein A
MTNRGEAAETPARGETSAREGTTETPAIRTTRLTKEYGQFVSVADLSVAIERGETVGLFGPNGAGKTTTLRILAGLTRPTRGSVFVDGTEMRPDDQTLRRRIGVVTHDSMLYDELTARENLRFHARLHGLDEVGQRCEQVLDTVGLSRRASRRPVEFSHGLRKRLSLARALLHDPDVLLLDEPYTGLDQRAGADLAATLDDLEDRTVVLTTHDLERGLHHCSRALVLDEGRLEADFSTASMGSDEFDERYRETIGLEPRATAVEGR